MRRTLRGAMVRSCNTILEEEEQIHEDEYDDAHPLLRSVIELTMKAKDFLKLNQEEYESTIFGVFFLPRRDGIPSP